MMGDLHLSGGVTVSNLSNFSDSLNVGGDLGISGAAVVGGAIEVRGESIFSGTLLVTGSQNVSPLSSQAEIVVSSQKFSGTVLKLRTSSHVVHNFIDAQGGLDGVSVFRVDSSGQLYVGGECWHDVAFT